MQLRFGIIEFIINSVETQRLKPSKLTYAGRSITEQWLPSGSERLRHQEFELHKPRPPCLHLPSLAFYSREELTTPSTTFASYFAVTHLPVTVRRAHSFPNNSALTAEPLMCLRLRNQSQRPIAVSANQIIVDLLMHSSDWFRLLEAMYDW